MKTKLIGVILLALVISCDENRVFEDNINQPNAYWLADSIAHFEFLISDIGPSYNILFNVRNGVHFPHSNLYIKYFLLDSLGNPLENELRNFELFHAKSGYPLGDGAGDIFESQFLLLKNYSFPDTGRYQINLQQYMRYDSLPEIYSVGVRVERSEP
jgi:gliding motility-associated lipoprotein GldH